MLEAGTTWADPVVVVATVKVGPVKARWKGKVRLSDFDPPNSYRISGEGDGGVSG